jgi:2-haloacid dehalogenase
LAEWPASQHVRCAGTRDARKFQTIPIRGFAEPCRFFTGSPEFEVRDEGFECHGEECSLNNARSNARECHAVPETINSHRFDKRTFLRIAGAALVAPVINPGFAATASEPKAKFDPGKIQAIVFDTVGTLLDTYGTITRKGAELTEARGIQVDWIRLLGQWNAEWRRRTDEIVAGTTPWRSADIVYREALDKVLASYDWSARLNSEDRDQLNHLWYQIEPWPDTRSGLERLRNRYTLSTLSNGSMASVVQMVKLGKLPFDCVLTAELVQSAKPDPKVYALAARSLNLRPDQILMVAAHKYDLAAAKKFGFSVAFLPRPLELGPHGKVDLTPEAFYDLTQPDLVHLAEALGT